MQLHGHEQAKKSHRAGRAQPSYFWGYKEQHTKQTYFLHQMLVAFFPQLFIFFHSFYIQSTFSLILPRIPFAFPKAEMHWYHHPVTNTPAFLQLSRPTKAFLKQKFLLLILAYCKLRQNIIFCSYIFNLCHDLPIQWSHFF